MAQIKTLQGVIRITESDSYEFVLPKKSGTSLPNALDNQVIEEVYIIVENPEEEITVNITLPYIPTFNNAWNAKIYVVNKQEQVLVVQPKPPAPGEEYNWINSIGSLNVSITGIGYFHVVDNNMYACWVTP
jgi:hypothetical protein